MISSLSKLTDLMKSRLINSFLTLPNNDDWTWTVALLLIFSSIVIPLGFRSRFLKYETPEISWKVRFRIIILTLFLPATTEEIFFRILLLPHENEQVSLATKYISGSISLILFVIYHPLNAALLFQNAKETFTNFIFLSFAALLSIVCTIAYFKSGSIYPPVTLHWIFVLGWLLGLGGYRRLHVRSN
jgi:predicted Abi (CAAX) family protease